MPDKKTDDSESRRRVGLLAFGSVISDPGKEIIEATEETISGVVTDFGVEFARRSSGRNGAPTLAPFDKGSPVSGTIYVLKDGIAADAAKDILFRRESNRIGTNRCYEKAAWMEIRESACQRPSHVSVVYYAHMQADLGDVEPYELARMAIASVDPRRSTRPRRDGLQYLAQIKGAGIVTPKLAKYESEILRQLGASSLEEALRITA